MSRDLSFLEIKPDDTDFMRSQKTYWRMVMDMPEDERKVFLQEERVKEEQRHLDWMIEQQQVDDEFYRTAIRNAKGNVQDYNMYKDMPDADKLLRNAELWHEIAISTKENRYTIQDTRKQRERVQWEKKKLTQLQTRLNKKPTSEELKHS